MARARGAAAWGCGGSGAYGVVVRMAAPLCALLASLVLVSAAGAQTGGAAPERKPAPRSAPAPRDVPSLPPVRSRAVLTRLACVTGCGANGAVKAGALLRVRGTGLRRTAEVGFGGVEGDADDVAAAAVKRRRTSVDVRV